MALNSLSMLLKNTNYGYVIDRPRQIRINHNLYIYIDHLKLYGANSDELKRLLDVVSHFSNSENTARKSSSFELRNNFDGPVCNAYLRIKQALDIQTSEMKEFLKQRLLKRVKIELAFHCNIHLGTTQKCGINFHF